tara:strand:- start:1101 stop:1349 length:249 start_codon:yes stop_codon:yes gene_type:complete
MKKRKHFRKKPKDNARGLSVTVFNNNVEGALKVLKKKVKESNLFLDLRKKEFYEKPSAIRRHKKQMAKLRNKYANEKVVKKY